MSESSCVAGRCCRAVLAAVALWCLAGTTGSAAPTEFTQFFPAVPDGQTAPPRRSGWRLRWDVLEPRTHAYGGSAILEFQSIEFLKGFKADASDDWIKILNNLALVEMYVPYNDVGRTAFFDISGFNFGLLPARQDYLPKHGVTSARIVDRYVIAEVVDEGVRWLDNADNFKIHRGQALRLWTTLHAANYSYTIMYDFADDGRISVRVGGTAQNLRNLNSDADRNEAAHVHMGAWRMEFDLGNASANHVHIMERVTDPQTNRPRVQMSQFNGNREGGVSWDPTSFSHMMVVNMETLNRHVPPRNVGYAIKPMTHGRLRGASPITQQDFWVSRLAPDDEVRRLQGPELKYVDLPGNLAVPEPIEGKPVVVWHNASHFHVPRGEDFGEQGYVASRGTAINAFVGFDLVPVDLWHKTPFLER